MIVVDTDILSLLQKLSGQTSRVLQERLERAAEHEIVCVTMISFEEQMRGWLDWIAKAKTIDQQVHRYAQLRGFLEDFKGRVLLDFDRQSADQFQELRKQKIRIGTMDLKIAAISLVHRATLVTRNLSHFRQVPGLQVEDWTQPT